MANTSKLRGGEVPPVNPQLMAAAREYVFQYQPVKRVPCRICGAPATDRSDRLCWICQRLKISAWRNTEVQEAAVE